MFSLQKSAFLKRHLAWLKNIITAAWNIKLTRFALGNSIPAFWNCYLTNTISIFCNSIKLTFEAPYAIMPDVAPSRTGAAPGRMKSPFGLRSLAAREQVMAEVQTDCLSARSTFATKLSSAAFPPHQPPATLITAEKENYYFKFKKTNEIVLKDARTVNFLSTSERVKHVLVLLRECVFERLALGKTFLQGSGPGVTPLRIFQLCF